MARPLAGDGLQNRGKGIPMNHIFVRTLSICFLALAVSVACSGSEPETATGSVSPVAAGPTSQLKFQAPSGWIEEDPSSRMRQAQYRLPAAVENGGEAAELVVFYFGGQGGSVQANIDRWLGQFRHADGSPLSRAEANLSTRSVEGMNVTIVDAGGTYRSSGGPMMRPGPAKPDFRMLAAIVESPTGPWFFKLTGPRKTVGSWEASFSEFIDNLRLEP